VAQLTTLQIATFGSAVGAGLTIVGATSISLAIGLYKGIDLVSTTMTIIAFILS
jgi:hypothetical protein